VTRRYLIAMRWLRVIVAVALGVPLLLLLGIQLLQYCGLVFRHAAIVPLRIQDANGTALPGIRLRFRESGPRNLIPVPFAPFWEAKGVIHDVTSDASGSATVSFRDETLYLDSISASGRAVTNFITVFHRYDGMNFTNQAQLGFFLHHGFYSEAKQPWRHPHTIVIP
jgi:hypothetical protein